MNKKIAIAVGSAAAVAFAGAAIAADLEIVNASEEYVDPAVAFGNVPVMPTINGDCTATFSAVGSCSLHGGETPAAAANNSFFDPAGPFIVDVDWMNITGYGLGLNDAFDNGLFSTGAGNHSYFAGLNWAWTNVDDALANPEIPQGAIQMMGTMAPHNNHRELWIDQTVVGYVVAWDSIGASDEFAQNFRSQLAWNGSNVKTALAIIDQRLEQSVNLVADAADHTWLTADVGGVYEASRQTLQQAFKVYAGPNTGIDPEGSDHLGGMGGGAEGDVETTSLDGTDHGGVNQLVSQDVEGFFFSCLGCDSADLLGSTGGTGGHALSGVPTVFTFQDYLTVLQTVPTVKHAAP